MQRTPLSMRCAAGQTVGKRNLRISGNSEAGQVPGQQERQWTRERTREWPHAGKPSDSQSRLKRSGREPERASHLRRRHGPQTWSQPTSAQQGRSVQTFTRAATGPIPNDLEEQGPHSTVPVRARATPHASSAFAPLTDLASRHTGAGCGGQLAVAWVHSFFPTEPGPAQTGSAAPNQSLSRACSLVSLTGKGEQTADVLHLVDVLHQSDNTPHPLLV